MVDKDLDQFMDEFYQEHGDLMKELEKNVKTDVADE